ncbi:MAG: aspartate carbamoyltransferase catalytic subunit [Clostridia bacterium]|nr:aspartate carbamoyltransferase catalytic subunit [Clostridia bacterium]
MSGWRRKDLLAIEGLSRDEVELILDTAVAMREVLERPVRKVPTLRGRTVLLLFFEPSTRTRASFELACKALSADTVSVAAAASSAAKGETLLDTVRNCERMGVDGVVVRHRASGAAAFLASRLRVSVINAGDGTHEHPTQALLDCFTIRERKGRVAGLRVAIVGDIVHSRVARSDVWALTCLGARVVVCGPPSLLPPCPEALPAEVTSDLEEALTGADVVIALRLQAERQAGPFLPSVEEYARFWGITEERLAAAAPDCLVLHPGPIHRGVELDPDVADGPRSAVLEQVTNGVAVRMACLYHLLGGVAR